MYLKNFKMHFTFISIFTLIFWLCLLFLTSSKPTIHNYYDINIQIKPNCSILFRSDADYELVQEAEKWIVPKIELETDARLANEVKKDCKLFLQHRKYFLSTNDDNERKFGIAFSIVTFKSASQMERLLRVVYRPWNYYCIHVDADASDEFFGAVDSLADCLKSTYGNILNTKMQVNVRWGKMTVLQADLNCMKELYERFKTWKYLINLTGQEFPLKTNKELVRILSAYEGANNIDGTYRYRNEERIPLVKMPFPLVWYKGSVHITANRDFIQYVLESPKASIILNALQDYDFADEQFFSTLNFNPQLRIAGSFIGDPDEKLDNQQSLLFLTRLKNWGDLPCLSQKRVRNICIWGVSDLPTLLQSKHLFANKFYEDFQPLTLRCLQEWYYDKVIKENSPNGTYFDTSFYKSMLFVINQFRPFK